MTTENNFLMFDTQADLEMRLRLLDAERAKLINALAAYRSVPTDDGWIGKDLDLNDMSIKAAIIKLLEYAVDHGKNDMSGGEIEDVLKNFRVRTSRGRPATETSKGLWLMVVRTLTAPGNAGDFKVQRSGTRGVARSDRVSLVKVPKRKTP